MKKTIVGALLIIMLFLSACSNSDSNKAGTTNNEKVTIRYDIWGESQLPAMEEIARSFEKTHPNILVKVEVLPWDQYWVKLETAATGSSAPDVVWMNKPNMAKYALNHVIADLTANIKKDGLDLNKYVPTVLQNYSMDGKVYGIPKDTDGIALWYNKELFDNAKVPYPDDTWDFAKLREVAKQLTNPAKGIWGIGAALSPINYYQSIYEAGGYIISDDLKTSGFDKPETIEGLKLWTDMILQDKSSPTLAQMTETEPRALFESGKLAMLFEGSWESIEFAQNEYTKNRVDVAVLPKGKVRAVSMMGLANSMLANTKYPEQTWEFMKFLGSKEAAEIQGRTGTIIPAYLGTEELWVKSIPKFNLKAFIDQFAYTKPYPASLSGDKWLTDAEKIFQKAWTGEISIEDAAKQAAQGMNKTLAEEQKLKK